MVLLARIWVSFRTMWRTAPALTWDDAGRVGAHAFRGADRYDAGQASGHLIERDAVHMRMEPVKAGRMVGRDLDGVVHRAGGHVDVRVGSGCGPSAAAAGLAGLSKLEENVVAVGIAGSFGAVGLDDQAVGVQVGRVADQVGMVGHVLGVGGRRQVVDQADFQRVARDQLQMHATEGMGAAGVGRCPGVGAVRGQTS